MATLTLLALFVVPVAYSLIDPYHRAGLSAGVDSVHTEVLKHARHPRKKVTAAIKILDIGLVLNY